MADDPTSAQGNRWMRRALWLAKRAEGAVEPNPMVGCVMVRDGRIIGDGYHRRFGGAHAEAEALADCERQGHDPRNCTAYVTLEPCAHHGKTPPCAEALIGAGVARVVAAMGDPSAHANGRGFAKLRDAGVTVEIGVCEREARQLNEPFIKRVTTGLPWVTAKWAQTLDGAIADADGRSKWISGDKSRRLVHRLRARVDAVVVGIGTAIADDPQLTARKVKVRRNARRVVVDPKLRLPESAKLVATISEKHPLTVAVHENLFAERPQRMQRLASKGVEFVALPAVGDSSQLDLRRLLSHLSEARSATNVLVEGGARLLGSLFDQRLVDQVIAFISPKLLADGGALRAAIGDKSRSLGDAHRFELRKVRRVGGDVVVDYHVMR